LCGERQPRSPGTSDKTILLFATSRPGECGAQNHIKRQGAEHLPVASRPLIKIPHAGEKEEKTNYIYFDGETYVVHMPDPTSRFSTT